VRDGEREGVRVFLEGRAGGHGLGIADRRRGVVRLGGRTRRAGGMYLEQQLVEGPLADARGARDDDGAGIANCCHLRVSVALQQHTRGSPPEQNSANWRRRLGVLRTLQPAETHQKPWRGKSTSETG
jgi:hypothetical protein